MLELLPHSEFDAVFAIMEQSFPADEYRPHHEQRALLEKDEYRLYVCKEQGSICAFIAMWQFEGLCYIEHFAVSPQKRNGGLGSKMLSEAVALSQNPVCLEVEPPENDLCKRRIAFYERNGFFFNDYPYTQPPISKGKSPVPLRIMSTGGRVTKQKFEYIRHTLYTKVYGFSEVE